MRETANATDRINKKIKSKNRKTSPSKDFRKAMMQKISTKENDSRTKVPSNQISYHNSNNSSESDNDDHHDEFDFYDSDNNLHYNAARHRTGHSTDGKTGSHTNNLPKSKQLRINHQNDDDDDDVGGKRLRRERGTGRDDDERGKNRRKEVGRERESERDRGTGRDRGRGRGRKERRIIGEKHIGNSINDSIRSIYQNAKKSGGQSDPTHSRKRGSDSTREDDDEEERGKRRETVSSATLLNRKQGKIRLSIN